MKTALIAMLLACMPAMSAELRGNAIVLTPQEMQRCVEGGGCAVITQSMLAEMQATLQFLMAELEAQIKAKTCRKGEGV
jgi:hypothetical protein